MLGMDSTCGSTGRWEIVEAQFPAHWVDYVPGSISNVGLIGRALTPDEVAALYKQGPG